MEEERKPSWGRSIPGELAEKWPRDEAGEFVTPAFLTSCTQMDMGDTVLISMLDAYGIPCLRRFPHYGGFGNLMLGMSAEGVDLFVPETMLTEALDLMKGEPEDEEL